jgi:hypothetical protein
MQVACSKGCGYPITVTEEQIRLAEELGAVLDVAHDICPPDRPRAPRLYVVTLSVKRFEAQEDGTYDRGGEFVMLADVSGTATANTFDQCTVVLSNVIADRWLTVKQMAKLADMDDIETPTNEGSMS